MKKKLLFLPIETTARELDAKILLAFYAIRLDYAVIIGHFRGVRESAQRISGGIFLSKGHQASFPSKRNKKVFFVGLDEEGFVFLNDKSFLKRVSGSLEGHLDLIFLNGEYQHDLALKSNSLLAPKCFVVGHPCFDLLQAPLNKELFEKKLLFNRGNPFILINTNFASSNIAKLYGMNSVEANAKCIREYKHREPTDEEISNFQRLESYSSILVSEYREMLVFVSQRYPEVDFVLRPHPSENHDFWRKALQGLENVYVIYEGKASEWIAHSLAVIHTGCTTGIEAFVLGKPVIQYNPCPDPELEQPLPNSVSFLTKNVEELCQTIDCVIKGSFHDKKRKEKMLHLCRFIDNAAEGSSCSRIMNLLDQLQPEELSLGFDILPQLNKNLFFSLSKARLFLKKHISLLSRLLGDKKTERLLGRSQKFPGLEKSYLEDKLRKFDKIMSFEDRNICTQNLFIKEIAGDTFIVWSQLSKIN